MMPDRGTWPGGAAPVLKTAQVQAYAINAEERMAVAYPQQAAS